eukprot:c25151_g3_i1 orf=396-3839(+)
MSLCCLHSSACDFRISRGFSKAGTSSKTEYGELQALDLLYCKGMHVSEDKVRVLLTRRAETRDLAYHRHVHTLMVGTGLDALGTLGDHLIRLFASGGSLLEATLAFCKIENSSVHTWCAVMSAHIMLGESAKVFSLYQMMQQGNTQPNKFVFSCILKACSSTGDLVQGKLVHEHIMRSGVKVDVVMGSALIDMYVKCGDLTMASEIFDGMPDKNIISYNIMLTGLVDHKRNIHAFALFQEIMQQGLELSIVTFLSILKACSNSGSYSKGRVIHDLCVKVGLEFDVSVGSALVDMYANFKSVEEACRVFDVLPTKTIVCWNALISGCSQQGCEHLVFEHFLRMQKAGIKPDEVTFSSISSVCGNLGAAGQGELVYDQLIRSGLHVDTIAGNTLVDMYGKCGRLMDAHNVFDRLSNKNVVSWNTLIAAYVQHGLSQFAVDLFEGMQRQGIKANNITLSCILSACSSLKDIGRGRALHEHAVKCGWCHDLHVGNALVDMYAKCGSVEDSFKAFDGLVVRNVVSWNALITGQVLNEQSPCVLGFFLEMLEDEVEPNKVSFLSLLKSCGILGYICKGMVLHAWIVNYELQMDVALGNMLVDMYIKCRGLDEARKTFDSMKSRDVISWGTMITGYAQHEHSYCAVKLFCQMQKEGLEPSTILLSCVLKACGSIQDIHHGRLIHKDLAARRLESDTYVANSLVGMYAECGDLEDASAVFIGFSARDLVTWNAMIAGYAQKGSNWCALEMFKDLLLEDLLPNEVTFSCILNACACTEFIEQGRLIHCQVCESDYHTDIVISNTLVNMYCKSGALDDAYLVLDQLRYQDVVAWNAMMAGYVDHGCGVFAIDLFEKMQEKDVRPDKITFACLVKACSSTGELKQGNTIHEKIVASRVTVDSFIGNALVDMYIKCGSLEEAMAVFGKLCDRDTVSFNTMISGCMQHEQGFFALQFFEKMQEEGIKPDGVTFLSTIKASGSIGAVTHGKWMHDKVLRLGLDSDVAIGNILVSMYSMCGRLAEATHSFVALPNRNMVSWSALITGYSQHGNYLQAAQCLDEMQRQGLKPVDMMFTSILSACSHEGKVKEGHEFFKFMKEHCGIEPSIEHYNCMLQLLGCAGHLKEAKHMLQTMPVTADMCSWMTLLIAFRSFGDVHAGRL